MKNVVKKSLSVAFAIIMALSCFATAFAEDLKLNLILDTKDAERSIHVTVAEAETVENITITISPSGGARTDVGNGNVLFYNLISGTKYTITATAEGYKGETSVTLKSVKAAPTSVNVGTTINSITVTKVNGSTTLTGLEFKLTKTVITKDETTEVKTDEVVYDWGTKTAFTGLESGTGYYVHARYAATDTYMASPEWSGRFYTQTPSSHPTQSVKLKNVTKNTITVEAYTNYKYSKDGGKSWQTSNEFKGLTAGETYFITQKYVDPEGKEVDSDLAPRINVQTNSLDVYTAKIADAKVTGISDGDKVSADSTITVKAPNVTRSSDDKNVQWGDTRYVAVKLYVGDKEKAAFENGSASVKLSSGSQKIKITYKQQIYKNGWVDTGAKEETKTITVTASTKAQDIFSVLTNQFPELIAKFIKWLIEKGISILIWF